MNPSSLSQAFEFTRDEIEGTVTARLARVVERFAENVALRGHDFCWTYRQLDQRVQQMARAIRRHTPAERGCVAFVCEISPWMVVASLAILKAGKIQLPLHPDQPLRAHQQTLGEAPPQLLLCSHFAWDRGIELAKSLQARCESLEGFGQDQDPGPLQEANESCDPCTLYFTSGSTGSPKGVVKSHRSLLHRCWLGGQHDQIAPADRQSLLTHASFASSEADIFATLLHGACLCVFDIARHGIAGFRDWVVKEEISLLHPPVLFFRKFLQSLEDGQCFDTVRLVALAGEVVVPADVEAWARHFPPHCQLRHRFSSTETALLAVAHLNTWDRPSERVPWGRAVADKSLEIWGSEQQLLGPGEVGELVVRSAYLAEGYWQRPEETASRFSVDPKDPGRRIFRTGDLGRILADGSFEFLGRRDGQVKIRGYRVSTLEVEEALLQLPAVSEASVGAQDSQLIAHVVLKRACTAAELRSELAHSLAEWKIPTQIHFPHELPKTLTGKVDRPQLLQHRGLLDRLGQLWQQLERPPVGIDEDLLQAGGDSITVVLLLNLVEQEWGVSLTPAEFFENRTLSGLAQRIAGAAPSLEPPVIQDVSLQEMKNVADFFLEQLVELGVEYVFLNPGTDSAPLLESWVKLEAQGHPTPTMVLCLHEAVALAAAHGYFMVSGKPQVVFVHVDLGTQNLGGNLHNAQRGQAGVILCAGRAPFAVDSRVAGGRDRYAHWIQEQKHQAGIVADYVKWHYQLPHQENLVPALDRALQLSACSPAGPVYLTLPREILLEKLRPVPPSRRELRRSRDVPDLDSLQRALEWLLQARSPLVIVSRLGRNPEAVADLVHFAELFSVPIVESRHRHNFPLDHPLHLGFQPLAHLHETDLVIVIDHEVPWIPDQWQPSKGCRVLQIDQDTEKESIPIWGFPVDLALKADSQIALQELCRMGRQQVTESQKQIFGQRHSKIEALHQQWRKHCRERAAASSSQPSIAPDWMGHCLSQVVGEKTLVVCEAATNNPALWEYLDLPQAGGFFQSLGSSLGWGLGAAFGAKLARPDREVVCVMGDGAWMFSNPLASYESARQQGVAFLTVVLNNQKYAAINEAVQSLAPSGWSRRQQSYPASSLPGIGYYQRVAGAIGMWSRTCQDPDRLLPDLEEALHQVRQGTPALLEIGLSSAHH